jgi:hypothetical protein
VKDSLLSTSKMVDANYIAVYDKEEVNFYDATRGSGPRNGNFLNGPKMVSE